MQPFAQFHDDMLIFYIIGGFVANLAVSVRVRTMAPAVAAFHATMNTIKLFNNMLDKAYIDTSRFPGDEILRFDKREVLELRDVGSLPRR